MFFKFEHMSALVLGGVVAAGLLTGCVSTSPGPNPQVTVTALSIPIDTSKSFDEQMQEVKDAYCKARNSPIASAVAEEAKGLWNDIATRAKAQGVSIPTFNPGDPQMCKGK